MEKQVSGGSAGTGTIVTLGLMSGTSLDGVDAAFVETDGEGVVRVGPSAMFAFTDAERDVLGEATQAALRWRFDGPRPNVMSRAEGVIEAAYLRAVETLRLDHPDWAERMALVGAHGQTVLHHPPQDGQVGRTLQLGDGAALASRLDCTVAWDFRSADVAAGGEGAPLAPILHAQVGTVVLNIGGVSNVTVSGNGLQASDCGPGNGLLDIWIERHTGQSYDAGGEISLRGTPDFVRVDRWLERPFFRKPTPRSADRHDFDVLDEMENLSVEDGAATLCLFTAEAVRATLLDLGCAPERVLVCGGGRHNRAIMLMLEQVLGCVVVPTEAEGWDGDALEAVLMGYLAVRTLRGLPISFPGTTGVVHPMVGGRVSRPV